MAKRVVDLPHARQTITATRQSIIHPNRDHASDPTCFGLASCNARPHHPQALPPAGQPVQPDLQHAIYMELLSSTRAHPTVHGHFGLPWKQQNSRIVQPPPRTVLQALQDQKHTGHDICEALDAVTAARVANSVRDTSVASYESHLKTVCSFCFLLEKEAVPAEIVTIRRYTALCNNPGTLRGHLAAWRLLHLVFGFEWPGDKDPFIRAVHAGLVRWLPARLPKLAIRIELATNIVLHCFRTGEAHHICFGIMASLAYLFALRVPSELIRQGHKDIIKITETHIYYGPIRRKGSATPVVLSRRCLCKTQHKILCAHFWYPHVGRAINPQAMAFNSWDCSSFNNMLRRVLTALNPSSQTVQKHCSHDFRRGCAKDMLAHAGPAAMMAHCGWKDKQSALHYVSQDEMHEQIIANMLSELSDDDN